MSECPAEGVIIGSFSNIDETSAFYEGVMLDLERRRAPEAGAPFDPDAADVRDGGKLASARPSMVWSCLTLMR